MSLNGSCESMWIDLGFVRTCCVSLWGSVNACYKHKYLWWHCWARWHRGESAWLWSASVWRCVARAWQVVILDMILWLWSLWAMVGHIWWTCVTHLGARVVTVVYEFMIAVYDNVTVYDLGRAWMCGELGSCFLGEVHETVIAVLWVCGASLWMCDGNVGTLFLICVSGCWIRVNVIWQVWLLANVRWFVMFIQAWNGSIIITHLWRMPWMYDDCFWNSRQIW